MATLADISAIVEGIGSDEDFVQMDTGGDAASKTQWVTFGIANYTNQCVKYTMAASVNTPATIEVTDTATDCGATN